MSEHDARLRAWRKDQQERTADLAALVCRLAGQPCRVPGWLVPVVLCELLGLRWDTFEHTYYRHQRANALRALMGKLTPEEAALLNTWLLVGDQIDQLESETER